MAPLRRVWISQHGVLQGMRAIIVDDGDTGVRDKGACPVCVKSNRVSNGLFEAEFCQFLDPAGMPDIVLWGCAQAWGKHGSAGGLQGAGTGEGRIEEIGPWAAILCVQQAWAGFHDRTNGAEDSQSRRS